VKLVSIVKNDPRKPLNKDSFLRLSYNICIAFGWQGENYLYRPGKPE